MALRSLLLFTFLAVLRSTVVHASDDLAQQAKDVVFVGNNWEGTVSILDPEDNYSLIRVVNAVPDFDERVAEIRSNPAAWVIYRGIRVVVGEGNDQLVDDMYSTLDGSSLVISRPSMGDVVSLDLTTGEIKWRFPMEGYRSDHMVLSPDGSEVAVSDSTANKVHFIDVETGESRGSFETGDTPHESHYLNGGRIIINASIGSVFNSFDMPLLQRSDAVKGDRRMTLYNRDTGEIRKIDMRERLDAAGRRDLSDAMRPFTWTNDDKLVYFQVSFFNGFIEYDFENDVILRVVTLPEGDAPNLRRQYTLDSRHHGIALNGANDKLCVAGTEDRYATIVDIATGQPGTLIPAELPYWATTNSDGTKCIISESKGDVITVIDFETGEKILSAPVGRHPQRVRNGRLSVEAQQV